MAAARHAASSASRTFPLVLAALGVVYGDIGTSPLYAVKECFSPHGGVAVTQANVLGVLSLVFWALVMVVTLKYLVFIMKADNRGEGGILALLALLPKPPGGPKARAGALTLLVIAGAALLYGDGIITPAISVLSAVEGLGVATHALEPAIVPITVVILIILFAVQYRGTEAVGRVFGPVMLVWFAVIGGVGFWHILDAPGVLKAVNPQYAIQFFSSNGFRGFALLGSVVLAVTGGEALYADMGHFGLRPIRMGWYGVALPGLLLSYFGQGALLLGHPGALENPFYEQVPDGVAKYALVALATCATVIASQALISGAFSLTHQAVQLGLLPRVTTRHTSEETEGQLYIPEVNLALAVGCLALVLEFRESSRLASAYGLAVTGTMAVTSIVYFAVARQTWKWPLWKALPLLLLFLFFDLGFLSANALKFWSGGYVPVIVGGAVFGMMVIWREGRVWLAKHLADSVPTLDDFMAECKQQNIQRSAGTAVFLASNAERVPPALVHLMRRVHVMPERVILLTIEVEHAPFVDTKGTLTVSHPAPSVVRVVAHVGYLQQANVPRILEHAAYRLGADIPRDKVTYYLGRETFLATNAGHMRALPERIFRLLHRNAKSVTVWFSIPADQVVELGTQIDL